MENIFEQKKKGQNNFRIKIDDFLAKSQYTKQSQQFTVPILQQLLSAPHLQGVYSNGKINVDKLCEKIAYTEGTACSKQLQRIIGKKELKTSDLYQLLKSFDLTSFDLQQEIMRHFFQNGSFSLQKMDTIMKSLGMAPLNTKDRQIFVECFDYDKNKVITKSDIQQMKTKCHEGRERQKKQLARSAITKSINQSNA